MVLTRITACALCVALASCTARAPASNGSGTVPSLTLVDTAGIKTALPDDFARAKLTVIVFYSEHCPCFRVHEERIREIARDYGPRGVNVLLVDSEVSQAQDRDAHSASERGLPSITLDPDGKLADALAADYATFTTVFDSRGRLRYRGGFDSDKNVLHDDTKSFLRDAIDDLLAGREPRYADGKALGCPLQKH